MVRIPFGIRQLDTTINGGAPPGSVVLASGEAGAGAREFCYTAPIVSALARENPDLFDLYYGDLPTDTRLPEELHYISFTASEEQFRDEVDKTFDQEVLDDALPELHYHDLSTAYFHVSPVPRSWYAQRAPSIKEMRTRNERDDLMSVLGDLLDDHAQGNLVVIDSLSDLVGAIGEQAELEWADIAYLVQGLSKAAHAWDCLIIVHVNFETITDTQLGQLVAAATGTLQFEWESGGSTRARTLVIKQFRGVLSQLEDEDIVRFETEFTDAGFDISDVRKIR